MVKCFIKLTNRLGRFLKNQNNNNNTKPSLEVIRQCKTCNTPLEGRKKRNKKFCSKECSWKDDEFTASMRGNYKGHKQSQETINKRISNTDQKKKESTKQATMIERYGVTNCSQLESCRKANSVRLKGSKHPRTKEWQSKIIESKRKNGTLKHTTETKVKLSKAIKKTVNAKDYDRSVFIRSHHTNHKTGHYGGFYYRSSYELAFIKYCEKYNISIVNAENKTYAVLYSKQEHYHTYYPDFYLPDLNLIVEIKPQSMLAFGSNPLKFEAARRKYGDRYVIVTEKVGLLNQNTDLLTYLMTR